MLEDSSGVDAIIESKGLKQVTDSFAIEKIVDEVIASNPMGDPCLATPAISKGVLYFRTTKSLIAIQ